MSDLQTTVPHGYCHCGCGEKTSIAECDNPKYGWVKGEPRRYRVGHVGAKSLREKMAQRTGAPDPNGCLPWYAATGTSSYGVLTHRGKTMTAHRWAWFEVNGEIPAGTHIHHKCHNPLCVNPDHLESVGAKEHGQKHLTAACPKGHPRNEQNTYTFVSSDGGVHRNCRICANEYQKKHYRNPPPERPCEWCGKVFKPRKGDQTFCTQVCAKPGRARRLKMARKSAAK